MKKILFSLIATFCFFISHSQTFWTEAFQNGCVSGCFATAYTGTNGAWTQTSTGTNDAQSNKWFVSGSECGNAAGVCGSTCGGTDPSLHIGVDDGFTTQDAGASYNAGGFCGTLFCVTTNMRTESPVINCSGKSTITLAFNYMENGDGVNDDASLWYYNGATWAQLDPLAKPPLGACSPSGKWTAFSIALPASANNNPNVKIGFNWKNNDDGIGTDPSFAVDDIALSAGTTGIASPADLAHTVSVYAADGNILVESSLPFRIMSVTDVLGKNLPAAMVGNKIILNESAMICFVHIEINESVIVKKVFVGNSNK
ncbi:MAG: hypothetical protein HY841_08575 [Bacteroidetes bacterium]|nr:hypothetical protein [Bacteroidota bacterium]